jgi:hypothetical protein
VAQHEDGDPAKPSECPSDQGDQRDYAAPKTHRSVLPGFAAKYFVKISLYKINYDYYTSWTSHTFPQDIERESGQKWRMEAIRGGCCEP